MTNAELFKKIFGFYATEMWAKPEFEFLTWINSPIQTPRDVAIIEREPLIQAGNHGKEVDVRISGRMFRIREIAQ